MPKTDDELLRALAEFMWTVEVVFDSDWEWSRTMLAPFNSMIAEDGTFLNPGVADESDDWGFRAMFLDAYRKLRIIMKDRGIELKSPME